MAEDLTVWPRARSRDQTRLLQNESYGMYFGLDDLDIENLHIIGLCCSSISCFASVVSIYWLVRMHRSFRHE